MPKTLPKEIEITSLTGPDTGWPIAAHCVHCRKTVITWSPYACKPKDGDFHLLMGTCLDEELGMKHNLYPQFENGSFWVMDMDVFWGNRLAR